MAGNVDARTHYFPYHRNEKYPRHLQVDFRKMKPTMLKKYVDTYDLPLRNDSNPNDMSVAVARHFDSYLEVDEDEVLARFMNAVRRVAPTNVHMPEPSAVGKRQAAKKAMDEDAMQEDDGNDVPRTRGGARGLGGPMGSAMEEGMDGGGMGPPGRGKNDRGGAAGPAGAGGNRYAEQPGMYGGIRPPVGAAGGGRMEDRRGSSGPAGMGGAGAGSGMDGGGGLDGDREVYCLCKREAFGEMIACDNENCQVEWFHLGCVGVSNSNRPKGKWYCPHCRLAMRQQRGGSDGVAGGAGMPAGAGRGYYDDMGSGAGQQQQYPGGGGGRMGPPPGATGAGMGMPRGAMPPPRGYPGMPPQGAMAAGPGGAAAAGGAAMAGAKRAANGQPIGPGPAGMIPRGPGPDRKGLAGPHGMGPTAGAILPGPGGPMGAPRRIVSNMMPGAPRPGYDAAYPVYGQMPAAGAPRQMPPQPNFPAAPRPGRR